MDRGEAARVLGVPPGTDWPDVRRAYRSRIRARHPDQAGPGSTTEAAAIIEAYSVLRMARIAEPDDRAEASETSPADPLRRRSPTPSPRAPMPPTSIQRLDEDTIAFDAPADETFGLLLEAAHDIGELTYVDRSVPILEVICRFVGTPALSLVITLQGRMDHTEAFCTVESIEARPGPPTAGVIDVLIDLLRQRQQSFDLRTMD